MKQGLDFLRASYLSALPKRYPADGKPQPLAWDEQIPSTL